MHPAHATSAPRLGSATQKDTGSLSQPGFSIIPKRDVLKRRPADDALACGIGPRQTARVLVRLIAL